MEVDPRWRKASFSDNGGNCVEVGQDGAGIAVRDSKDPGPVLAFDPNRWQEFTRQVKYTVDPA
jgi:hypothetical protein